MKIWLCNPYGPLPGEAWREARYAMLGRALARHGHDVIWWTASFCHHSKTVRSHVSRDITVEPNFTIRLVPTPSYKLHVGLARLRFEFLFALRLYRMARISEAPEAIVSSDVTMALAPVAESLATRFDAHLVFDILDLSPEVFAGALPSWLRSYAKTVFWPLYALRDHHFKQASAVTAVCDDYLLPGRCANPLLPEDLMLTVYLGADLEAFRRSKADCSQIVKLTERFGKREDDVFAIYAGTLGVLYDIDALLGAAKLLHATSNLKILIAGGGPRATDIREFIAQHALSNVLLVGEVGFTELVRLYQICDIGLSLYGVNSPVAMPIKVFDYLAAGLPVVNSIGGFLEKLLRERHIGVQYKAGDATALAAALHQMSSDIVVRRKMAENARNAATEFDSTLQYGRFAKLLEHLEEMRANRRRSGRVEHSELQMNQI
jgi:glycosyltransferase involved in cell wall biosynthesis